MPRKQKTPEKPPEPTPVALETKEQLMERLVATATEADLEQLNYRLCVLDVVFFFSEYILAYDPRTVQKVVPFKPRPRQVEFLHWLEEREKAAEPEEGNGSGIVVKPRDEGVTTLCAGFALHRFLFRQNYVIGFGSRKLELVDRKGDPSSIFEKIRFMFYNLPQWMRPPRWKDGQHDKVAQFIHPSNGSSIIGEGGDQIGRGGRTGAYFADEKAFFEKAEMANRALSFNTRCQIDVSTHNGPGTVFHQDILSGRLPVFEFGWRENPVKNRTETLPDGRTVYPWYEAQKKRLDPVTLAQEVDCDPYASVEGILIKVEWVRAAVELNLPKGDECGAGLDIAEEGSNESVLAIRRGPVVEPLIAWTKKDTSATADIAWKHLVAHNCKVVCFDHPGIGGGVRGEWKKKAREGQAPPFHARPINTGSRPTDEKWPDGKTSKEKFFNLKAELWWKLRMRFEKTYEFVTSGVQHPPEEMISIPNDPDLIRQLSTTQTDPSDSGKIKLMSKRQLKQKGIKSPDRADAVVLCFHDGERSVYLTRGLRILTAVPSEVPAMAEARKQREWWENPEDDEDAA